ncbi:hypothetical protein [Streptomyces sirii]|uniref:hypothetical protein n=1 Tax=Streptomyces sirii TaxID=3127701 RepID=UPI003D36AE7C
MRLSVVDPLYKESGPFAAIHLDISRHSAIDDPDTAIALRWRHLHKGLLSEGADPDSIAAVASTVGRDVDVPGAHGQALFIAHGKLTLRDEPPEPPAPDRAHFGTLPDALPLIVQHAPEISHLAVRVHYTDAHSKEAPGTVRVDSEVGTWPLTKVRPGERGHEKVPGHGPSTRTAETLLSTRHALRQGSQR